MPGTAAASAKTANKKAAMIATEDTQLSINHDQPQNDAEKKPAYYE
jgi:hypothetical protein